MGDPLPAGDAGAVGEIKPPAAGEPKGAEKVVHHHEFLLMVQTTLKFLVCALFVLTFIAQPYRIPSGSMENTLLIGDFLLVNKVVFANPGPWKRLLAYEPVADNDIVVFHYPVDGASYLVKRVIGSPGDEVRLYHGVVFVDGREPAEPYALYLPSYPDPFRDEFPTSTYTNPNVRSRWWREMQRDTDHGRLQVSPGKYFVLGDNRNDSLDSRYWGLVPRANIVGEPFLVYFSLVTPNRSEITGRSGDRLAHERGWWHRFTGAARWSRMFHVIR